MRANADTPQDAAKAREFGAEGIGLCRTEHMFMAEDRLPLVRAMIMASGEDERRQTLEKLLPHQQEDFEGIFEAMAGLPVTIRLLDPPLHEFLPPLDEAESPEMARRIRALREANPMLGTRGCRLGLLYPEIYEMQVRAIVRAAAAVEERTGNAPLVEIMHPLVGFAEELHRLRELTVGRPPKWPTRRLSLRDDDRASASLRARRRDRGARRLLQLRDERPHADDARLLARRRRGQVPDALPRRADPRTRTRSRPSTRAAWGISCRSPSSAHAASSPTSSSASAESTAAIPRSVAFCHDLGLDYVSCSPYRVPLATARGRAGRARGSGRRRGAGRRLAARGTM